jgi:biotin synthase-related radical SAM superfamily protein
LDILEPIITAVKKELGLLIGVQTPPHHDLNRYHNLRKIGVNRVSFCFEIYDEPTFKEICPGKDAQYGLKRYLDAVEFCTDIFDVTNGEIVAGLEPPESSIAAIDWMTSKGAIPTVCVFRPLKGTDLQDTPPPKTEDMIPVFRRMYEACMDNDLPIGIAPNVKVSLVLLPEEGRYFVDDPGKYRMKRLKLAAMRTAFATAFYSGLKR